MIYGIIAWSMTVVTACIVLTGCGDASKPPEAKLALVYPKGGESLGFGDTIPVLFRANGAFMTGVDVQVSSDNGQNYFHIRNSSVTISGSGVNDYSLRWIIGKEEEYDIKRLYRDTAFGGATNPNPVWKCRMKVSQDDDKTVNDVSNDFTVTFTKPYCLRYPVGGETYRFTDSIPIVSTRRSDKSSIIERFFWSQKLNDWYQITAKRNPKPRSALITEIKYFVPSDTAYLKVSIDDSTRIRINDYGVKIPIESGYIKIQK